MELNPTIKVIALVGFFLILYGLIPKLIPIYFFWESSELGYVLLIGSIGVILLVEFLIRIKILNSYYRTGWRTLFHIIFASLVIGIGISFYFSNSLKEAKKELRLNRELIETVGEVKGFGWLTSGSSSTLSNSDGTFVWAQYVILVKGTKAYKTITVNVQKNNEEPWAIEIIKSR